MYILQFEIGHFNKLYDIVQIFKKYHLLQPFLYIGIVLIYARDVENNG